MKNQKEQPKSNCEEENQQLLSALENYNQYILSQLKNIDDFDIWYETKFNKDFPKCWYSLIRTRKL